MGIITASNILFAQNFTEKDTISLSRDQAETIFIQKNLFLISEKLNIDQAEAQVIQAKLWSNPTLSVSEINLWSNATSEQLPPISGNWGRTSQIGVELEQVILTAGKRRKMIAIEKVAVDMSKEYFEELLRNLKIEFRNNITELQYIQAQNYLYKKQLTSIQKLLAAYANQVKVGNISRSEYIRLKASELEFLKQISNLEIENNKIQKELKILMNLPSYTYIKFDSDSLAPEINKIEEINITLLITTALENRPDIKAVKLEKLYNTNRYKYELALKTPDIALSANFDRGGNIMNNFVGLGFAIDLPFFNRNQGNIKSAKIAIEKSKLATEEKTTRVHSEIIQAYSNLLSVKKLHENIDVEYEKDLDVLLDNHLKNFTQRNTSMLEYLDYVEAYIENKTIILNLKKEINQHFEELQFVIGQDIK